MSASFPIGLNQPDNSYRFGLDALLLAAFSASLVPLKQPVKAIELGTGCGAALFGFALLRPLAICTGLEREVELINSSQINAVKLSLNRRCNFYRQDLRYFNNEENWKVDIAFANPPWREKQSGKVSNKKLRLGALWAEEDSADIFCESARKVLKDAGLFCIILPENKADEYIAINAQKELFLFNILRVKSFASHSVKRVMLSFVYRINTNKVLEQAPLILYSSLNTWSARALEFCPWLAKKRS